jgi:hypothetical protein
MRLIWTGFGVLAIALGASTSTIACGSDGEGTDATEGSSGGTPTSTDGMTTMSTGMSATPITDSESSSGDAGSESGNPSTGEPSDGTASTGSTGAPATGSSGTDSGSSDGGTSSSTGEPVGETETESTGGMMSQACADGCAVEFACGVEWDSAEECTEWCNANLGFAARFSPFCMQAWEELSVCLGTLDCTQYAQWQAPVAFPYPCYQEDDALAFECDGQ